MNEDAVLWQEFLVNRESQLGIGVRHDLYRPSVRANDGYASLNQHRGSL